MYGNLDSASRGSTIFMMSPHKTSFGAERWRLMNEPFTFPKVSPAIGNQNPEETARERQEAHNRAEAIKAASVEGTDMWGRTLRDLLSLEDEKEATQKNCEEQVRAEAEKKKRQIAEQYQRIVDQPLQKEWENAAFRDHLKLYFRAGMRALLLGGVLLSAAALKLYEDSRSKGEVMSPMRGTKIDERTPAIILKDDLTPPEDVSASPSDTNNR